MNISIIPALNDNYSYLIGCPTSKEAAIIDPANFNAAVQEIENKGMHLKKIINTHHHWDHVASNEELKKHFNCEVLGFNQDQSRIPGFTTPLEEGQKINIGHLECEVMHTPGHTRGHISLYFSKEGVLFTGDTLFSCGCGRLFEGTPDQMMASLQRLGGLPDRTKVFCGHEYTQTNITFARTMEPSNHELAKYSERVARLRHEGKPTIPSTIEIEKQNNPFVRCGSSDEIYERVKSEFSSISNDPVAIFAAVRRLKDCF